MKILMFTDLTFPCDHSFLEEVYVKRLSQKGNEITWIMRVDEKHRELLQNEIQFWGNNRVFLIDNAGLSSVKSLLKTAMQSMVSVPQLINRLDWDILQVRNDPVFGLLGLREARKRNLPFVFQYTFYKSRAHMENRITDINSKVKSGLGGKIEDYILQESDLILPISNTMKDELINRGISGHKMLTCTLGVDDEILRKKFDKAGKRQVEAIKAKYGLGSNVILYLGTMMKMRKLEFLVDVFKKVKSQIDNAQIMFVGDSPNAEDVNSLRKAFEQEGFIVGKDVIFTGRVARAEVYSYISASATCVSPIPPIPLYKVASPIKLMDYLVCGKPVVGNYGIDEQEKIIAESEAGFCVRYVSDEFSNALITLLKNEKLRLTMGENGRRFVIKNYGYSAIADKLIDRYEVMLQSKLEGFE